MMLSTTYAPTLAAWCNQGGRLTAGCIVGLVWGGCTAGCISFFVGKVYCWLPQGLPHLFEGWARTGCDPFVPGGMCHWLHQWLVCMGAMSCSLCQGTELLAAFLTLYEGSLAAGGGEDCLPAAPAAAAAAVVCPAAAAAAAAVGGQWPRQQVPQVAALLAAALEGQQAAGGQLRGAGCIEAAPAVPPRHLLRRARPPAR